MPNTTAATLQTIWDCKWSRPGYRLIGIGDRHQLQKQWVCFRTGPGRVVTEEECENCPFWEELSDRSPAHWTP